MRLAIVCTIFFVISSLQVLSKISVNLEAGAVYNSYNCVRIPGDEGTKFSISDNFNQSNFFASRVRLEFDYGTKHYAYLTLAPLQVFGNGTLDNEVQFMNGIFLPDVNTRSTYKFNTYRLTYRYQWHPSEAISFGLGATALIRDAKIQLEQNDVIEYKSNVGVVPLLNFYFEADLVCDKFAFVLEGDALAAPQGRAEDVLLALKYSVFKDTEMYLGYRFIEGGSDTDTVYNFATLHFAVFGMRIGFPHFIP